MVVDTRRKTDDSELRQLEALWNTPAREVRRMPHPASRWLAERGWRLLTIAWPAVLLSLFLAPASEDEAAIPWYAWTLFGLFSLAVVGMLAAAFGTFGAPLKWSLVAGGFGVALGVGCLTSGHHTSGWALYELGAFCALTLLSAATIAAGRSVKRRS